MEHDDVLRFVYVCLFVCFILPPTKRVFAIIPSSLPFILHNLQVILFLVVLCKHYVKLSCERNLLKLILNI